MRVSAFLGAACLSLVATTPALAQGKPQSIYDVLGIKQPGLRGAELDAAVKKADAYPLGSEKNPVRVQGVAGEQAYLGRLRCSNGRAPKVGGRSIGMPSPFGGVTDVFSLTCDAAQPATAAVTIDMYHETVEARAVPGFTIAPQ